MVGSVGPLVHERTVGRLLALEVRGHHDAGGANLALDVPVLIEAPVHQVLVVRDGRVEGDDEAARAAYFGACYLVHVLPQDSVVFLVDADGVLYDVRLALRVVEGGVEVRDLPEAVAPELQRGRHEPEAPFSDVEGGAAVVVG